MEQNLYIKILKYGSENIGKQITKEELFEQLKIKQYEKSLDKSIVDNIFESIFKQITLGGAKYVISLDSYFQYLEHIRLEEARKDSKKAIGISVVAIIISIILTLIQIFKC
ncbi:MAG: hypothetical protein HY959_13415 [Ignavibacteriae bacterium]|nr:hypothetical protein [Ignavibacteriota bacterium]